jgi:hypothetical protein
MTSTERQSDGKKRMARKAQEIAKEPAKVWEEEGDFEDLQINFYRCIIRRHPRLKTLEGLVMLIPSHAYFGLSTDDPKVRNLKVHGGIDCAKYGNEKNGETSARSWWLGFSCDLEGDLIPAAPETHATGVYRTFAFVRAELEKLTTQLGDNLPHLEALLGKGGVSALAARLERR